MRLIARGCHRRSTPVRNSVTFTPARATNACRGTTDALARGHLDSSQGVVMKVIESRGAWRVALGLVAAAAVVGAPSTSHAAPVACDVAIVGGGPGGVHTAYKLA